MASSRATAGGRDGSDAVQAIRVAADLADIVSEYIPLKKSGTRYRALCPFHTEKTPSFYVDPDKQLYYCFGCSAGGDVFKFLMQYEKLEFPEALKLLAARYNIPLPVARAPQSTERQRVLAANRQALGFFRDQLQRPAGARAREYLTSRGVGRETIEQFLLGVAPSGWTGLKEFLALGSSGSRESRESQGVSAGLLARKAETGRTYDRFRDRIMFPILDLADEVIGFGGRSIEGGEPKYLNSPETAAFSKGENLYGLPLAKQAIRKCGHVILVEGYMDVIALHAAGFAQAVATLGTGFTAGHVRLLKRYTESVVVNFDPDAAGRAAARRSLEVLLENGFDVRVVSLPAGKDPDLYVREQGADAYRARLGEGLSCMEYLTREVAARFDLAQPGGKVAALNEVLPFLTRLDHPVRRAGYVEMLAAVFGIEDRMVLQELNDAVRERRREIGSRVMTALGERRRVSEAESMLVRALMDARDVREQLLPEIEESDIETSRVQEIVKAVQRTAAAGDEVTYPGVGSEVSREAADVLTWIAATPHPEVTIEEGRGCLIAMRAARFQMQMGEIQKRLESEGIAAETDELLRRKVVLKRRIEALRGAATR